MKLLLPCIALLAGIARAQVTATSLAEMADRSDCIVQARVLHVHARSPVLRRVIARPSATLAGTPPQRTFELIERGPRGCGQALHGVARNVTYLFFLRRTPNGGVELLGGGARCVAMLEPGMAEHVRALTQRSDRAATLVAGLDSRSPRVREDAALALATAADLESLDASARSRVAEALCASVAAGDTKAVQLLTAGTRLHLSETVVDLVDRYMASASRTNELAVPIRRALARIDAAATSRAVLARLPGADSTRTDRALELLRELPASHAAAGLEQIARSADRTLRVRAGAAWLEKGLSGRGLRDIVTPQEYLECHECNAKPPRFRSIRVSRIR